MSPRAGRYTEMTLKHAAGGRPRGKPQGDRNVDLEYPTGDDQCWFRKRDEKW
jgi:hypothetical protein